VSLADDLYDRYGEMCITHRNPRDPDVAAVLHDVALIARVDLAEGAESACGCRAGFDAIVARCVAAHQYADDGWRPSS